MQALSQHNHTQPRAHKRAQTCDALGAEAACKLLEREVSAGHGGRASAHRFPGSEHPHGHLRPPHVHLHHRPEPHASFAKQDR
eukprot:1735341-Rhodomonas_salina.1